MVGKQAKRRTIAFIAVAACSVVLSACQSLPPQADRTFSTHREITDSPALIRALDVPKLPKNQTAVYLLDNPQDAFAARQIMVESAQHTLDIQYYIWHNDVAGREMLKHIQAAARRGVHVRILLDDNNTYGMDNLLSVFNREPNIEVRLFNPFTYRRFRTLGYLSDFSRLNHRMHNKSFIADNTLAIIGGRNIGDEYFNISKQAVFSDLDVLLSGNAVQQASQDFDRYWNSAASYPFERIATHAETQQGQIEIAVNEPQDQQILKPYREMLQAAPLTRQMEKRNIPWRITENVQWISDAPEKALGKTDSESVTDMLSEKLGTPKTNLFIVSPYFIPTKHGTKELSELAKSGIQVTVFTNSLQATDVAAAHAGYAKYRKPLLASGVELYEMKPDAMTAQDSAEEDAEREVGYLKNQKKQKHFTPEGNEKGKRIPGSSATSLHAKAIVVDNQKLFIGSFNMDPRSAHLNTENGIVINDRAIAESVVNKLRQITPQYAYKVTLDRYSRLQWQSADQPDTPLNTEPEAGFWKRFTVNLMSVLPIEDWL